MAQPAKSRPQPRKPRPRPRSGVKRKPAPRSIWAIAYAESYEPPTQAEQEAYDEEESFLLPVERFTQNLIDLGLTLRVDRGQVKIVGRGSDNPFLATEIEKRRAGVIEYLRSMSSEESPTDKSE